jgi:hypothetical protein
MNSTWQNLNPRLLPNQIAIVEVQKLDVFLGSLKVSCSLMPIHPSAQFRQGKTAAAVAVAVSFLPGA